MSVKLRKDLIDEIERRIANRLGVYDFGELFTQGTTIITKKIFDSIIAEQFNRGKGKELAGEVEIIADPNHLVDWKAFTAAIRASVSKKNRRARLWQTVGPAEVNDTSITFKYKRKFDSRTKSGRSKGNMEEAFNNMLKQAVRDFLTKMKPDQIIYSHGKKLPRDFRVIDDPNLPGGSAPGMGKFPGGQGTRSHHAIATETIKLLGSKAQSIAKRPGLMKRLMRVVDAKFQDMFESNSQVRKQRSEKEILDSLEYSGQLILETKDNPGGPDADILKEMKRFLDLNQDEFIKEAFKLTKMNKQTLANLWSGSSNTVDALIAIGKGNLVTKLGKLNRKKVKVTKAGGLDMRFEVNKQLVAEMKAAIKDKSSGKTKTKRKRKSSSRNVTLSAGAMGARYRKQSKSRVGDAVGDNPLALATLINRALPEVVASKMTSPALNYRTGRFAQSAEVKNITVGPRGGTAVEYTYRKDPYQTFEPGYAMGSTQRDPRKIIGESIRQIAQGIVGNKFLTTRRV